MCAQNSLLPPRNLISFLAKQTLRARTIRRYTPLAGIPSRAHPLARTKPLYPDLELFAPSGQERGRTSKAVGYIPGYSHILWLRFLHPQMLVTMDRFILFGDSLFQHSFNQERGFAFGAALSNDYVRRLDVVNRGLSGYNTRQALQVLPRAIPSPQYANIRFMTFFFGANDSRLPDTPGGPQQHIPLAEFRDNMTAMVSHPDVHAHKGIRIILITPPPVDERKTLESDKKNDPNFPDVIRRKASVTAQYAQVVRDIGKEMETPVLDLWTALVERAGGNSYDPEPVGSIKMPKNDTLRDFLHDGLHLSPAGYQVLHSEMIKLIASEWPDQTPDKLPFVLPAWDNQKAWSR